MRILLDFHRDGVAQVVEAQLHLLFQLIFLGHLLNLLRLFLLQLLLHFLFAVVLLGPVRHNRRLSRMLQQLVLVFLILHLLLLIGHNVMDGLRFGDSLLMVLFNLDLLLFLLFDVKLLYLIRLYQLSG